MGTGKKVALDSNIFISAFGWGGKPLRIIQLMEKGVLANCTSDAILGELTRAVAYPKLGFNPRLQARILEFVLSHSEIYEPRASVRISADADDNKFIECALESMADYIITGDRKLLEIRQFRHVKIFSPYDFLAVKK